jgi:hypothetical protein
METSPAPQPATALTTNLHYQLVYTLTDLLPPPLDDTPAALRARNHAAIAKVAALLPVNANELDLAAQCIAARAQAEDILRLIRQNANDIAMVMRLNAQYASMLRTSLSVHARLMRAQAVRQKREAIDGAANQDAWAQHITEQSMLAVADPQTEPPLPTPAPTAPLAARLNSQNTQTLSEIQPTSQTTTFETPLRAHLRTPRPTESAETNLREIIRKAMAEAASPQQPAYGRQTTDTAARSPMSA